MNKYILIIVLLLFSVSMSKLYIDKCNEYQHIKDIHTTELIQRDSSNRVFELTKNQLENIIIKKDSTISDIIKRHDIEIKRINSISKIHIKDTVVIDSTILKYEYINRDTTLLFNHQIKCHNITGDLTIKNGVIDLNFKNLSSDIRIDVVQYVDVIKWHNFKKRRKFGYPLMGLRKRQIEKVVAKSNCYDENINIDFMKVIK